MSCSKDGSQLCISTVSEVDWFDDGPVDVLGPRQSLDVDEMSVDWPDVLFIFRDSDQISARAAKILNNLAEELRSIVEVIKFITSFCHILPH